MPISLRCSCGKMLTLRDELAGRRIKCPACGGVLAVPASEPEEVEPSSPEEPEADESDDVEDRPKKKSQKSKTKGRLALTKEELAVIKKEKKEKAFKREKERREMIRRLFAGLAYFVLGLVATIGSIYALITFWQAMLVQPEYGVGIVFGLVVGLAAVVKGVLGLMSVRFSRQEED
ncbi:MAG: hypothetical protein L0215_25435 [Gemmataceae bacterium]|nr:hypothetical protein [Gemmataceae bacterium]